MIHIFSWFKKLYSRRPGSHNPRGQNFNVNRKLLSLRLFATSFKKSFWSLILYNCFHNFIHVYSPGAGAENPFGMEFWCQQEHLVTSVICCKFQKNLFEVWFNTCFFIILYMYRVPGQGADSPKGTKCLCQQKCLVTSFICCKFQKMSLKSYFIKKTKTWLIHAYSPWAGVDSPQGIKVWCQQKDLITLPICCKFQRNLFEVWFYTIFAWFNTCI